MPAHSKSALLGVSAVCLVAALPGCPAEPVAGMGGPEEAARFGQQLVAAGAADIEFTYLQWVEPHTVSSGDTRPTAYRLTDPERLAALSDHLAALEWSRKDPDVVLSAATRIYIRPVTGGPPPRGPMDDPEGPEVVIVPGVIVPGTDGRHLVTFGEHFGSTSAEARTNDDDLIDALLSWAGEVPRRRPSADIGVDETDDHPYRPDGDAAPTRARFAGAAEIAVFGPPVWTTDPRTGSQGYAAAAPAAVLTDRPSIAALAGLLPERPAVVPAGPDALLGTPVASLRVTFAGRERPFWLHVFPGAARFVAPGGGVPAGSVEEREMLYEFPLPPEVADRVGELAPGGAASGDVSDLPG